MHGGRGQSVWNRPLARNKILRVLYILETLNARMASTEAVHVYDSHYWPNWVFFNGKPMLVDIMTVIIGPFDFCTGKPMQVEENIFFDGSPSPV